MAVDSTVVKMGIDWNLVKIADYPTYRGYAAKLTSAVIVKIGYAVCSTKFELTGWYFR